MPFSLGNMGSNISIIVAVPFILVALGLAWAGIRGQRRAQSIKSWPTTSGRILSATTQMRRRSGKGGYASYPHIMYEYTVGGRQYVSTRVTMGMEMGGSLYTPRVLARYPIGATVQVYYSPENPSDSALEASAPGNRMLIVIAVIIIVMLVVSMGFTFGGMTFILNQVNQMLKGIGR
jgi:Protein of unknown function (DUF3592)